MTFFCVKTRIFATKVHFLLDNAKVLREKSKRGRCGGTQERKKDARKQSKSGKTTVTPVVLPLLIIISIIRNLLFCQ